MTSSESRHRQPDHHDAGRSPTTILELGYTNPRPKRPELTQTIRPILIPAEWHDHALLTFEQFCGLIQIPPRTVRDWRRRGIGPRFTKLEGAGRLYLTVGEARRFLGIAATRTEPAPDRRRLTEPGELAMTHIDPTADPVAERRGDQSQDHPHRDLLTPSQLADRWGVSTGHLANLRHLGQGLSYVKIGSRVAYRYVDVLAYEGAHYVAIS